MDIIFKLGLILSLLFTTSFASLAAELVAHKASYTAKIKKGISIKGNAVRELKKTQSGQWLYSFNVRSFIADIDESTLLSWHENQVVADIYKYKLSAVLARDKLKQVNFDWRKMTATNPLKKKGWEISNIPVKSFDRLSYQLQLAMDLQSGKQEMHYYVADKGKLRQNYFRVTGEQKIKTAIGEIQSITVEKVRGKGKKRKTDLWFSKQYPFLLLKMVQVEKDGEQYEINITQASIDAKNVTFDREVAK